MICSRLSFKYTLRQCRVHDEQIKADKLTNDLKNKDSMSFWKALSRTSKLNTPLPENVNGACGSSNVVKIVFKAKKSYCVVFKPKRYKPKYPTVSLAGTVIPNLNFVKYLRVILTDNLQDDEEIMKQTRSLYAHGNVLLRKFGLCSS